MTARLITVPPEPLGCRQWRAFFDPEGEVGFGKTEAAAIRDLLIDRLDGWSLDAADVSKVVAAFEAKP